MKLAIFCSRYGCSEELFTHLRAMHADLPRTPMGRFVAQRAGAHARGITWELTFTQWWAIWEESGHYEDRGASRGKYCMARNWDSGAYAVGNVSIQTVTTNLETKFTRMSFRRVRTCGVVCREDQQDKFIDELDRLAG